MAKIIPVPVFDCVVFGATGDLTLRKLLPALYYRFRDGQMPDGLHGSSAAARSDLDDGDVPQPRGARRCRSMSPRATSIPRRLQRVPGAGCTMSGWMRPSRTRTGRRWRRCWTADRVRVFYLATSPDLYGPVCREPGRSRAGAPKSPAWCWKSRSATIWPRRAQINDDVGEVFSEAQTFRIDHYLGKETVQNLLALRFANTIFERLWTTDVIDHVQITVAETVGLEGRAGYYDHAGALRDMVQNHMLQLLCLIAMEPPVSLDADRVRDEKLKVLRALRPIEPHEVATLTVRGQYAQGAIDGKPVPGYLADLGDDETAARPRRSSR